MPPSSKASKARFAARSSVPRRSISRSSQIKHSSQVFSFQRERWSEGIVNDLLPRVGRGSELLHLKRNFAPCDVAIAGKDLPAQHVGSLTQSAAGRGQYIWSKLCRAI